MFYNPKDRMDQTASVSISLYKRVSTVVISSVGFDSSRWYWCLQLCTVMAGQAVMRKLDETQTANMVKAAARPPDERKRRIMDAVRHMERLI